jgi:DNA ligase (NAD+)
MYAKIDQKAIYDLSIELLNSDIKVDQIDQLRTILKYHEYKYSVENNPVISDYEYDILYKKLEKLEKEYPDLVVADSPTQRVSNDLIATFTNVTHLTPMLSLANSYNAEDLLDFDRQIRKFTGLREDDAIEYAVEPKFDGGSIALIYENDKLVRAATRGNGFEGDEMTPNAMAMGSIPLFAKFSAKGIAKAELRGEALIRKEVFEKLNKKRAEEGLVLFANARNSATGGLRTKDASETKRRGIETFIFQLGYAVDEDGNDKLPELGDHFDTINYLGELGFKIPHNAKKLCNNILEAIEFCTYWQIHREEYPYEIDGMVVKVNKILLQKKAGSTAHHPRWAIAYKFKAKQATTKLLTVEYQVGKVGSITPVAKVKPVQLAGVTVSSISLHNEDFIKSKDLRIGDTVLIERAGDVIPYIVKALDDLRDGSEEAIVFPKFCPINDQAEPIRLIQEEGEAAWRCSHCICGAQDLQKMIFHVSKPAMNIDGFGASHIEKFYELGWIRDMADIYNLNYEHIASLEGFGDKSAKNLQQAIENVKSNSLTRILHSLSIHHLGQRASKLLAQQIKNIFELQDWDNDRFVSIKDIGPVVAENVMAYFKDERNIQMLRRMEEYGVDMTQKEEDKPLEVAEDGSFVGKSILFTGSLQQMTRKEAQELAAKEGARNISAVSSKLDVLVVGEKAGSKLKKARDLGTVTIMTEQEFLDAVDK